MKLLSNGVKGTGKYLKSWVISPTNKETISYMSCLIFFKSPIIDEAKKHKFILYQSLLLLGNMPANFHAFHTNFTQWKLNKPYLTYMGEIYDEVKNVTRTMMDIDPNDIYIHFKVGDTQHSIDYITANYDHYEWYVTNPDNKTYGLIVDQIKEVTTVYDLTKEYGKASPVPVKERCKQIIDPRFHNYGHCVYGKKLEHSLYKGLKLHMI